MGYKDIDLSEKQQKELTDYRTRYGDKWADERELDIRRREYIERNLEVVDRTSQSIGRCASRGTIIYKRRDGGAITADDTQAVAEDFIGQENSAEVAGDGMTITRKYMVDSSD